MTEEQERAFRHLLHLLAPAKSPPYQCSRLSLEAGASQRCPCPQQLPWSFGFSLSCGNRRVKEQLQLHVRELKAGQQEGRHCPLVREAGRGTLCQCQCLRGTEPEGLGRVDSPRFPCLSLALPLPDEAPVKKNQKNSQCAQIDEAVPGTVLACLPKEHLLLHSGISPGFAAISSGGMKSVLCLQSSWKSARGEREPQGGWMGGLLFI